MITDRFLPAVLVAAPLLLPGMPAGAQSERVPAEPAPAAGADAAQQDAGSSGRGPIAGGRYRQPTQADIDARLRRQEQQARNDRNKELDDLYNEALRLSAPKRQ
jgi:hypothetical protein